MACPCDRIPFPRRPDIAAGLTRLPRQPATFAELRADFLAHVPDHPALAAWRGRAGDDDPGLLLVDMWAYLADALGFYDEVVAHEQYLATARQRRSLERLVGLTGYRPSPASSASAVLAIQAEGTTAVTLPAGTAVRSSGFDDEPPHVFEITGEPTVHPWTNGWTVRVPPRTTAPFAGVHTALYLDPASARVRDGDRVLVSGVGDGTESALARVTGSARVRGADGQAHVEVTLEPGVPLDATTPLAGVRLLRASARASLWSAVVTGNPSAVAASGGAHRITLDGVHRAIGASEPVVVTLGTEARWFTVAGLSEERLAVVPAQSITSGSDTITVPAATAPATRVLLDTSINTAARAFDGPGTASWSATDAPSLALDYAFKEVGRVRWPADPTLPPGGDLLLDPTPKEPTGTPWRPRRFVLEDADGTAVLLDGSVDWATGRLVPDAGSTWALPLVHPISVRGNVVDATRGESQREVLGSGDASVAGQAFDLGKNPLSYTPHSTLEIWVDGVRWSPVDTLFRQPADARVYTVRHDEEGRATVLFGDGVEGARLPSGADNVVAVYRSGAGAAAPPAASLGQLAGAVAGVRSVTNPIPAFGGGDREPEDALRTRAPRGALVLGRAVSLPDLEALAAGVPGVEAVHAAWAWHGSRQQATAHVWYVGAVGLEGLIEADLDAATDPNLILEVARSEPRVATLSLDVEIEPDRDPAPVLAAVRTRLTGADGTLTPARLGTGVPLFRSRVFAAVLSVPGTCTVRDATLDGSALPVASDPGAGRHWDIAAGGLFLNGGLEP